jgi:NRDE-2, necessary for RNA interference
VNLTQAVALFQALIEFNLFAPKQTIGWPFLRKLNAFQDFWDKECPRFGEDGALGWRNSMDLDAYICTDEQAFSGEFEDIEDQFKRFYLNELSASFDEWYLTLIQVSETGVA